MREVGRRIANWYRVGHLWHEYSVDADWVQYAVKKPRASKKVNNQPWRSLSPLTGRTA